MTKTNYGTIFKNGIFGENPVFRLALSLCPAVAVTSGVKNGFLMGVAVLFVMTMVNATVSLLRKFISPKVRIPSYMFIIATWVTVTDQVMAAYQRAVYKDMGLMMGFLNWIDRKFFGGTGSSGGAHSYKSKVILHFSLTRRVLCWNMS